MQLGKTHGRRLDGARVILSEPAEVFPGERPDFSGRFFCPETLRQILERHPAMPAIQIKSRATRHPPEPRHPPQGQALDEPDHQPARKINQGIHARVSAAAR